jgi:hypothetical protein
MRKQGVCQNTEAVALMRSNKRPGRIRRAIRYCDLAGEAISGK